MTPRELRAAIATGDAKKVSAAVKACGSVLASDDVGVDRDALGEGLFGLTGHPTSAVRQALAEICDLLPDVHFERVVEVLANDSDRYVRNGATTAAARKVTKKKARGKREQQAQQLQGLLEEIQAKDGKGARRRAEAAVRRGVDQFVRRLDHEVGKTDGRSMQIVLALRAELAKPDASVALMRRHVAALDEQIDFRQAIMKRARDYATPVKPMFVEESIAAVVDEARRQLAARVGERAARLKVGVDIDPELVAEVDKHALLQALQNVLQNAVEAYPVERAELPLRIAARVMRATSLLELRVVDEGGGISKTERERMFVPFGSTKPGGTGVGMLTVRTMVEEVHGGELGIESEVGVGTTVTMLLPMRQRGAR